MNTLSAQPRLLKTAALMLHPRTPDHEAEAAGAAFARLARAAKLAVDDLFCAPRIEQPRQDHQRDRQPGKVRRPAACRVVMPWGRHEGERLGEIAENDPGYLKWLVDEASMAPALRRAVEIVYDHYTGGAA